MICFNWGQHSYYKNVLKGFLLLCKGCNRCCLPHGELTVWSSQPLLVDFGEVELSPAQQCWLEPQISFLWQHSWDHSSVDTSRFSKSGIKRFQSQQRSFPPQTALESSDHRNTIGLLSYVVLRDGPLCLHSSSSFWCSFLSVCSDWNRSCSGHQYDMTHVRSHNSPLEYQQLHLVFLNFLRR